VPEPTFLSAAERAAPTPVAKRRATVRYALDADTACAPLAAWGASQGWEARIRDISRGGLGLLLDRRLEPGTLITVDLPLTPDCPRLLLARVVHATAQPDGGWLVGCALFDLLPEEELARTGETTAPSEPPETFLG
jgi:hypothetical protein